MVIYKKAEEKDMLAVAKLHHMCFQGYFLTKLGIDLLEKYYIEYIKENDIFVLAIDDEIKDVNNIIGFCMGYYHSTNSRSNFETKYKKQLFVKLLKMCLCFDKEAIKRCFDKIKAALKSKKTIKKRETEFTLGADLLSICILPEYRQHGVAGQLITEFENIIIEKKDPPIKFCTLTTRAENKKAQRCFDRQGFNILEEKDGMITYVKYYK